MEFEPFPNEERLVIARPEITNIKKPQLHGIFSLTEMMLRSSHAISTFQGLMFVPQQTVVTSPVSPQAKAERQLPALLL